jgi:hypothetical protein
VFRDIISRNINIIAPRSFVGSVITSIARRYPFPGNEIFAFKAARWKAAVGNVHEKLDYSIKGKRCSLELGL